MTLLTSQQKDAISKALAKRPDNTLFALDPADAEDAAAIHSFLALTGKSADTHPGLFADIAAAGTRAGSADSSNHVLQIVDSGHDSHHRATCRAWYLDRRGAYLSGSLALALDADSGEAVALGSANRVGGGLTPAATRSASAGRAPERLTSVGFYHSQSAPGETPQFGAVKNTQALTLATTGVDANVTQPVITVSGHTSIQIGLGRPQAGVDLDYFYPQDTNDNPVLAVPFTGTVNVQQPLNYLDGNGHFTQGLSLVTYIYSLAGTSYSDHLATQDLTSGVTGNASSNVVTWSYPYNTNDYTQSVLYDPLAATRDTTSAFYFQFNIPVNNIAAPYFSFNVCSYDWPEMPSVNCVQIPDLQFWWHCVAANALITLGDGSTLELEKIDNTKRVRTAGGGTLGVEATTRGLHTIAKSGKPVDGIYELRSKGGHSVVLTGGHPVVTPNGLVLACDLVAGTEIITDKGIDTVAACQASGYDGVFCNLSLVDAKDRAAGLAGAVGTFFANGIAVGDYTSMANAHYNSTHSLDYMKTRIPEKYHRDYASTLEMIARDNARYGTRY